MCDATLCDAARDTLASCPHSRCALSRYLLGALGIAQRLDELGVPNRV